MNLKPAYLLLTILTLNNLSSCGQTQVIIPKEYVETIPPKVGSREWYSLNYSSNAFAVKIIDGKLEIEEADEDKACELKLSTGKLVGINRGEWGGKLIFEPTDTNKSNVEIKRGNIKFIFTFKSKIYFIEGLAHMGYSAGALFELDTTDQKFTSTKLIDFDDAPEAFTIYQDKFLIATHERFYIVKDFKKELILENTFWSGLYPNSIAVLDEKNVFIGMRGGIVKLDLTTKALTLYMRDK
jgi:Zn/Cd-binding protein ZinT